MENSKTEIPPEDRLLYNELLVLQTENKQLIAKQCEIKRNLYDYKFVHFPYNFLIYL